VPSRRKTREFVLQVLFAADVQGKNPCDVFAIVEANFAEDPDETLRMDRVVKEFAFKLVHTVASEGASIDAVVGRLSHHWKLYRMNRVDRCILRMAIAEMAAFPEIPPSVTLNEAVDLGKKYGAEQSAAFINGILDPIHAIKTSGPILRTAKDILTGLDASRTNS
jgi:transcription antitermination protein NusB